MCVDKGLSEDYIQLDPVRGWFFERERRFASVDLRDGGTASSSDGRKAVRDGNVPELPERSPGGRGPEGSRSLGCGSEERAQGLLRR